MATRRARKVFVSYELGQRRCPLCSCQMVYNPCQPNTASFEHLVPKSSGGTEADVNGLVVCRRCNANRGNMCWEKWLNQLNPPKKEYTSITLHLHSITKPSALFKSRKIL